MRYELYIDRLLFLNFCMNFMVLSLLNASYGRAAPRWRTAAGAAFGAAGYLAVLLLPFVPGWVKIAVGFPATGIGMLWLMYPGSRAGFLMKAFAGMMGYTFLIGGGILFLQRTILRLGKQTLSITGVIGMGAVICCAVSCAAAWRRKKQCLYQVCFCFPERNIEVKAWMDTGNSLVEPISGKPVSLLEKDVIAKQGIMLPEEKCRAIPYHSLGKKHGILIGYEFPKMIIRMDGAEKTFEQVMVGLSEDKLFAGKDYEMLLHPEFVRDQEDYK